MTGLHVLFFVAAGVAAGLAGSIAGLASLVSYPALLAAGLPPLTANVTNTVAVVFSGVGSALGSRPELRGQRGRLRHLGVLAVLGGGAGCALLLLTPADTFEFVVPWLVAAGALVLLAQPRLRHLGTGRRDRRASRSGRLAAGTFLVSIYGGYFGAGAGVLLLAVILAATGESLARSNALKNVLLGVANAVAALGFAAFGPVRWGAALPLAVGFLAGGHLGPALVRRAPAGLLRIGIGLAGLGLAVKLGLDAYG